MYYSDYIEECEKKLCKNRKYDVLSEYDIMLIKKGLWTKKRSRFNN